MGVFKPEILADDQVIGLVNRDNITISKKVNGTATIIASIPAFNEIIRVIDGVLLMLPNK